MSSRVGGRHAGGDLTSGPVPQVLFRQAWPQAAEGIFNVADQITDLFWAGHLEGGFRAIAGVGVVQAWLRFAMTAQQGLVTSMRAMVARALGARDHPLANHVAVQSISLGAAYSLLVIVAGILLTDVLMAVVGASADVRAQASTYMRLQFVFLGLVSWRMHLGGALQVSGDPGTALKSTAIARGAHMLFSPLFMFGWAGFPELGLAGAALANVVGQLLAIALSAYALFRGNTLLRLSFKGFRMDLPLWRRFIKIGYPSSVSGMERGLSQLVLLRMVTPFGDAATAIFGVMGRMEVIGQFGSMGVGSASGAIVGQNLGAGRTDRARQAVRWGVLYVCAAGAVTCTLFILFPSYLLDIFLDDPQVLALGVDWLRIQALAFFFMGIGTVYMQSYNTAGDTVPPMLVSLASVWLVELPLAYALTQWTSLGALGIPVAAILGMGLRLFFYVPYYFSGRWLRARVL